MNRISLLALPAVCSMLLVVGGAAVAAPVVTEPLVKGASGSAPAAIVAGTNGAFSVLNSGPSSVIQYDAVGQQASGPAALLPDMSAPSAMLSNAYGLLYVANPGSHSVSVVDTKTMKVTTIALPAADKPFALGMSSTRDVYALKTNDEITKIDSADKVTLTFAKLPAGSGAKAIVTDFGGYSYTANAASDTISQVSPAGVVVEYAKLPAGSHPAALLFDRLGRLVVAEGSSDALTAFDTSKPAGTAPVATYALPAGAHPAALAVDEFNTLYIADAGTNSIEVLPSGAGRPLVVARLQSTPSALTIGSNNKLLIASSVGDTVSSVDLDTKIVTSTIGPMTVATPFTGAVTATGVGDIAFSSPDLPAWLKLDPATGALTGTPPAAGSVTFTLRAVSSTGRGDARTLRFDVSAAPVTPTGTPGTGSPTGGAGGAGGSGGAGTGSTGGSSSHTTNTLAHTGAGDAAPAGLAAATALLIGLAAFAVARLRRARRSV